MNEREQRRLDRELASCGDPDAIARTSRLPVSGDVLREALTAANQRAEALQAKVDAAERLVGKWRRPTMGHSGLFRRECADELASAISQTRGG